MDNIFLNRFRNSLRFYGAVLAITILALFVVPNAFACHRDDTPHGKDTDCGGGSGFPPGVFMTEVYFSDAMGHFESSPGLEFELSPNRDYDSGDYISNPTDFFIIDSRSLSKRVLRGRKNGDLCQAMNSGLSGSGPFVSVPDEFSFGWTDDCRDGQCAVEISLRFSGIDVEEISNGRSDEVEIVMYTVITDQSIDDDPFRESRELTINLVEVEYNKFGTSRTLVACQFTAGGQGSGVFHSMSQ